MVKRNNVREPTSEPTTAAELPKTEGEIELESPAVAIEETAWGPSEATDAAIESTRPEPKMPPVAQLRDSPPTIPPLSFAGRQEDRPAARTGSTADRIEPRNIVPPVAPARPKSRFPLLAATLALAAGLGGAAGAIGIPALFRATAAPAAAPAINEALIELQTTRGLVGQLSSDIVALKTAVEQSSKATAGQFGKVNERLDRTEHALADPAAKLAKIGEAIDRLEHRAPAAPAHNDVTGSVNPQPAPEAKPKPTIIEDYVLRKVFDGVALIEGKRGIAEVEPGSVIPGAGRVEEIRRQDGRWVVVTTKGLIAPPR